ncbi:hypothetical protein QTP88_009392 [Uroleucon formosanum]
MFRFPKDARNEIWVVNSGNRGLLELDVDKLYNKYLCQEHFSSNDFMQGNKKSLKPTAIPYRYNVTSEEEPSTSAGTGQLQFLTPTKTYYKPRAADTAVELVFPSPTSSTSSIIHIEKKFQHKSYKEKACTVCFDEMYIKEFLEYSKDYDFIEGFQNLGASTPEHARDEHREHNYSEQNIAIAVCTQYRCRTDVSHKLDSGQFENFARMSREDFEHLVSLLTPIIAKQTTHFREPIPVNERFAVTLRFLATDCVVYDEAGVLKNVNDLCNYVINNEGYVDNPNHLEDNDVNMLNLTNIISNNDTLSLENCNVINSSSFDADDSVVHDKINSNDLSISNICTDHTQTLEVFNNLSETEPKQRKNIAEPKGWDRNKSKTLRMKGCAYLGYRRENPKNTNKILHDVMRESRKMGATCNSPTCKRWKNRCCNTISEDERGKIFNELWKEMNWDSKKMFVCSTVEIMATKQKTVEGGNSRRGSSFFYFLRINGKKIPVCQSMYLNTLGLNKSEVRYWIQNFKNTNLPTIKCNEFIEENENDNDNYAREKDRSLVRKPLQKIVTLQNFFDSLPTLPSHYCRKTSKKLFLQTDIKSWTQLYKLYTENCKKNSEAPVSRHTFDREKKERNIDIYIPKKDRCDTCISFENHHITNESYEKHLKRKESARNEK